MKYSKALQVLFVRRASARILALAAFVLLLPVGAASAESGGSAPSSPSDRVISASEDIDFDILVDDLGSTEAIDFITKLNLNSELDNLIEAFHRYHRGSGGDSLTMLYARFDHLLQTTLALIEDRDPPLFLKLERSRPRLWHMLVDREEFHAAMADADIAPLKGSVRHSCCR
jgi:hypothetical protein